MTLLGEILGEALLQDCLDEIGQRCRPEDSEEFTHVLYMEVIHKHLRLRGVTLTYLHAILSGEGGNRNERAADTVESHRKEIQRLQRSFMEDALPCYLFQTISYSPRVDSVEINPIMDLKAPVTDLAEVLGKDTADACIAEIQRRSDPDDSWEFVHTLRTEILKKWCRRKPLAFENLRPLFLTDEGDDESGYGIRATLGTPKYNAAQRLNETLCEIHKLEHGCISTLMLTLIEEIRPEVDV